VLVRPAHHAAFFTWRRKMELKKNDGDILSEYLTKTELAMQLNRSVRSVDRWALNGDGPPCVRIGREVYIDGRRWLSGLCASILGGSSVLSRIAVGWLLDRFFGPRVAFLVNRITALEIFLLARVSSFPGGCVAAALIGIGAGGEAATTPDLLTRYFGLRAFSTLYGLTWTFYAAAGAIGPVILGHAFDATGSYASLLVLLAAALGLVAAINFFLPKYPDLSVDLARSTD
jgi:hypothetical protein